MKIRTVTPGNPIKQDITVMRNDTFQWTFRGWSNDSSPFNFSGYSFSMQVRRSSRQEEVDLTIPDSSFSPAWDDVGMEIDRLNVMNIVHPDSQMGLEPGRYVYDIEMTSPDGLIKQTIYYGDFIVRADTSR